jgi:hypothetical protein
VGDHYGLSFESRNLVGLGGSPDPGSSDHHPTETIEALAWRSADYLAQNLNDLAV